MLAVVMTITLDSVSPIAMGSFRGLASAASYSGVYNSENIYFVSLLKYSFLSSPSSGPTSLCD